MKVSSTDLARVYAATILGGGINPHVRARDAVMAFLDLIEDLTGKPPRYFEEPLRPEDKIIG